LRRQHVGGNASTNTSNENSENADNRQTACKMRCVVAPSGVRAPCWRWHAAAIRSFSVRAKQAMDCCGQAMCGGGERPGRTARVSGMWGPVVWRTRTSGCASRRRAGSKSLSVAVVRCGAAVKIMVGGAEGQWYASLPGITPAQVLQTWRRCWY